MNDAEIDYRLSFAAKKKVEGNLPVKRDIQDWGETKLMAFLKFVQFFTDGESFKVTAETIATAEERAGMEPFWDEFLRRINITPGIEEGTARKFYYRFLAFTRIPLAWLKENPHGVSEPMFAIMDKNPRMQWACKNFKMVTTESGVQIVTMDQDEKTDPARTNATGDHVRVDTPLVAFEESKLSMLTMLRELGKSIPMSELKKMPIKDRLAAFDRLLNTAQKVVGAARPNSVIFQQINVGKAGRDELEKLVLGYAETQEV